MFRFLILVIAALVVFMACENDTEIVQPNPELTMSYSDFMDNAPGAPSLEPGIHELQDLHCTNIRGKQFYEWAGILVGVDFLAGEQDVGTPTHMLIVHATLVRIPDGQDGDVQFVHVYPPNDTIAFSFPFSVNRPSVILKRTRQRLRWLAQDLGGSTMHSGFPDFDDMSVETAEIFPCASVEALSPTHVVYETNTAIETAAIADVTQLKFPKHLITIDGTEMKMRDRFPVRFYDNETNANAYRDYRRQHRQFFPIGDWYNIGLFHKGPGASDRDGRMLTMAHTGFDPIQNFVEEEFPETVAEQSAFVRPNISTSFQSDLDNGYLYIKFSPPFDKKQEAINFDHAAAADATTHTADKIDLRFGFEADVRTSQDQQGAFATRDIGSDAVVASDIAIYTDETDMDNIVVKGIASDTSGGGVASTVTLNGVTLTRKSRLTFREGASLGTLLQDLRNFFGFTDFWDESSTQTSAPPRPTTLPVLLVLNTDDGTLSTTDPRNLYSIPNAHKIKWYVSAATADTAKTTIEAGARVFTYFNVTQ